MIQLFKLSQNPWTYEQDQILKKCFIRLGNSWEQIARHLPGRSANQVKNRIRNKEFRGLFQTSTISGTLPKSYVPKSLVRPTIKEQQTRIDIKTEENNKRVLQEVRKDMNSDLVEQAPVPAELLRIVDRSKKKYVSKKKRFAIMLMHIQRIYKLIEQNLEKNKESIMHLIFQKKTKKQIFDKIKFMQWTISQFWPIVTNRPERDSSEQQIAFFLYTLIKADNPLSNKIIHRIIKCENQDYLMRKFESIIGDIDSFIEKELQMTRDREILMQYNQEEEEQILKINIDEDDDWFKPSKKYKKKQHKLQQLPKSKRQHSQGDSNITNMNRQDSSESPSGINKQKFMQLIDLKEEPDLDQQVASSHKSDNEFINENNYDFMMKSKELTIGNRFKFNKDAISKVKLETAKESVKEEAPPSKVVKKSRLQIECEELLKESQSLIGKARVQNTQRLRQQQMSRKLKPQKVISNSSEEEYFNPKMSINEQELFNRQEEDRMQEQQGYGSDGLVSQSEQQESNHNMNTFDGDQPVDFTIAVQLLEQQTNPESWTIFAPDKTQEGQWINQEVKRMINGKENQQSAQKEQGIDSIIESIKMKIKDLSSKRSLQGYTQTIETQQLSDKQAEANQIQQGQRQQNEFSREQEEQEKLRSSQIQNNENEHLQEYEIEEGEIVGSSDKSENS